MQVGEPAATAASSSNPPRKEWEAQVIEITFKTNITAARDKAAIAAPHWKEGEDPSDTWSLTSSLGLPDAPYSKKAAVYLVKAAGGPKDVEVKVRVTKCVNVSGTGKLKGAIGSLEIEGDCPLAAGEHTVAAQITEMPDAINHFRGQINWGVDADDIGCVSMNSSLVELFFVLAAPISAYTPGVWVEALRLVCLRGPVTGIEKKDEDRVVANVTRYSHYGLSGSGGSFELSNYLAKASTTVNCYDQAGAVQTLSGAVGVTVVWIYLQPYGFINPTQLVGVGQCNNPFFSSNGSTAMVPSDDARRTAFGNHAFNEHTNIFDACAGPHVGTEARAAYVTAAIDATPALYARYRGRLVPGTTANMTVYSGVTGVS
jgi:hypothetical protein